MNEQYISMAYCMANGCDKFSEKYVLIFGFQVSNHNEKKNLFGPNLVYFIWDENLSDVQHVLHYEMDFCNFAPL